MSAGKHFKNGKASRWPGQHLAIPAAVLNCRAFLGLSAQAVKLLLDLGSQYRGDNNGDLCAAWKVMRKRGWKSEDTLNKAKKELIAAELISETRKGGFPNRTTLYGLTWFRLDYCGGKLSVTGRGFPFGGFIHADLRGIAARATRPNGNPLNPAGVASDLEQRRTT